MCLCACIYRLSSGAQLCNLEVASKCEVLLFGIYTRQYIFNIYIYFTMKAY